MSKLPAGWKTASIDEIADLADGPFGSNLKTAHYTDSGPRVVRLQNIAPGLFRDERAHIAMDHYEHLIKYAVRFGDIVAASLGDDAPRACLVPPWLGPAIVKADCIRIRPRGGVDPTFLMWTLNSPSVRHQAASSIKGVGRPRLGLGGMRGLVVPIPPTREQRRIVTAIEQHFSHLEAAEHSLERARLVVSHLRARSLLTLLEDERWETHLLEEVNDPARPIRYGILMPKEHVEDGVLYVKVKDYPNGTVLLDQLRRTSHEIAGRYRRSTLRTNDVLLSIRGTYGRVAITPPELEGGNITQDTARIAPLPLLDPQFLIAYLRSETSQQYFRRVARGVAVKGVNIGDLRQMRVPVPARDEQERIVVELERQHSLIDALAVGADAALKRSKALRRSILARAFTGKLVPQDPADEPASVLLERIAAERAAAPSPTRRRKKVSA